MLESEISSEAEHRGKWEKRVTAVIHSLVLASRFISITSRGAPFNSGLRENEVRIIHYRMLLAESYMRNCK